MSSVEVFSELDSVISTVVLESTVVVESVVTSEVAEVFVVAAVLELDELSVPQPTQVAARRIDAVRIENIVNYPLSKANGLPTQ